MSRSSPHGGRADRNVSPVIEMASDSGAVDSEEKLRGIISLAADAIISTDGDFRITLFNPAAERIFDYRADEVLGESLDILLPEAAREIHHAHVARFRHSSVSGKEMGQRGQIWGRRRSGELFPAEASISKIGLGLRRISLQYCGTSRSSDARKQSERRCSRARCRPAR